MKIFNLKIFENGSKSKSDNGNGNNGNNDHNDHNPHKKTTTTTTPLPMICFTAFQDCVGNPGYPSSVYQTTDISYGDAPFNTRLTDGVYIYISIIQHYGTTSPWSYPYFSVNVVDGEIGCPTTTTTTNAPTTTTTTTRHSHHKKDRVLFILKDNYYHHGYTQSYGLGNSSRMIAEYLETQGIACDVVSVLDSEQIDIEVDDFRPTIVIIEALWLSATRLNELSDKYHKIKWVVRIHSNVGFLAVETKALSQVHNYLKLKNENVVLSSNNEEFNEELTKVLYTNFEYLPNIVDVDEYNDYKNHEHHHHDINIGCFGALRVLKNQLFQAMCAIDAADRLNKTLYFHVNKDSEIIDSPVLKNLEELFEINGKHHLVIHDWLEHDDFVELINTMDLGLQVSFTESFNLITADFVNECVPVIVSETIAWMPRISMVSTVDFEDVVEKIIHVYNSNDKHLIRKSKRNLIRFNDNSKYTWDKFVNNKNMEIFEIFF